MSTKTFCDRCHTEITGPAITMVWKVSRGDGYERFGDPRWDLCTVCSREVAAFVIAAPSVDHAGNATGTEVSK